MKHEKQLMRIFVYLLCASFLLYIAVIPNPNFIPASFRLVRKSIEHHFMCGDFLARWHIKPSEVYFMRCEYVSYPDPGRLVALYTMRDSDAEAVEDKLRQALGKTALHSSLPERMAVAAKTDGLTELVDDDYIDREGKHFEIVMLGYGPSFNHLPKGSAPHLKKLSNGEQLSKFTIMITRYL